MHFRFPTIFLRFPGKREPKKSKSIFSPPLSNFKREKVHVNVQLVPLSSLPVLLTHICSCCKGNLFLQNCQKSGFWHHLLTRAPNTILFFLGGIVKYPLPAFGEIRRGRGRAGNVQFHALSSPNNKLFFSSFKIPSSPLCFWVGGRTGRQKKATIKGARVKKSELRSIKQFNLEVGSEEFPWHACTEGALASSD